MSEPGRSANVLVGLILKTPGLLAQVKADPEKTLEALAAQATTAWPPPAFVTDVWVYRMVVLALGLVCSCAVVGTIYLTSTWASLSASLILRKTSFDSPDSNLIAISRSRTLAFAPVKN